MSQDLVRMLTTRTCDLVRSGAVVFSSWDLQRLRAAPVIVLPTAPIR